MQMTGLDIAERVVNGYEKGQMRATRITVMFLLLMLLGAVGWNRFNRVHAQSPHYMAVTWTPTTGAAGYNVYRSTISGSGYVKLGTCLASQLNDNTVAGGIKYYYIVRAIDAAGNESANSNETTAIAIATLPPPTNVVATPH